MKGYKFFIGQTIVLAFVLGIIDFVLLMVLGFNNMGGETPLESIQNWNMVFYGVITFPISIFMDFNLINWPFSVLALTNLLIKSAILLGILNLLLNIRNRSKT